MDHWTSRLDRLRPRSQAFIGGAFVDAASGATFDTVSPRDGRVIASVAKCDGEDVDRAVQAARRSFESGTWARQAPRARRQTLLRLADLIEHHHEELALLEAVDMGKPVMDAYQIDLNSVMTCIRFYAEAIDKIYDEVAPTAHDVLGLITREPLGVVGAVVPWNFPLLMAAWKLGPALATGNSVVLKPAEQSPLSALRLAELASEAGLPDGVLNVVPGFGDAGEAIGRHLDVDAVGFTGSTEVGKLFLRYAGESNMKVVSLECGGKSPQIVMADAADLDKAAQNVAMGIFFNQGEVCNAGSRLLVESSIKDDLLARVVELGRQMRPGDPLDPATKMGAIVDQGQLDRVMGYIDSGVREGAALVDGGNRALVDSGGFYVEPTVFDAVTNDMRIAREEIFGPVLATISFDHIDDAIAIANDTDYGLAASIWTSDINVAHRTAKQLRAGTVWVNCFDSSDITVPFGGYKLSGVGRDKSLHALDKYTQLKTTWIELS
jgi:acyl-CoA reductase-like NAD-dependent aldehyde dehydrogenase